VAITILYQIRTIHSIMTHLIIRSFPHVLNGTINLPSSKSISNRVLIIRYLSGWKGLIHNLSDATDTMLLNEILSSGRKDINTDNAGTVMRFLTAVLAIIEGKYLLSGSERMNERPIGPLVDALLLIGAEIEYTKKYGYPPIIITGKKLTGGKINIKANVSSQFISALLMIAPFLENGLRINLTTKPVSTDYIRMTIDLMKYFGVEVAIEADTFSVKPQHYIPKEITIESDWSSAAYIYALASIKPGSQFKLNGLTQNSIQGDQIISVIMEQFGVQTSYDSSGVSIKSRDIQPKYFEFDFTNFPDLVPVMTVLCSVKKIPFHFTGVGHLRYKESDRLAALQKELDKTGAIISIGENEIKSVEYKQIPDQTVVLNSYNDHRLAMSFALCSCADNNVQISGIEVVDKSYPGFWKDLMRVGMRV
jgi:3-phosphoshikimate 1-carboxyvinyltransferase